MSPKIKSFTQLIAWQKAHSLVIDMYSIIKDNFPIEEKYGLSDQMRRASISIFSNIAEGFSRKSLKDKSHFYYIALGSLTELQNQLLISRDLSYINNERFKELANKTVEVNKLINSLIKGLSSS